MSEQNILNPSATSVFSPDYGYGETLPEMRSIFQARSGGIFSRQAQGLGRVFTFAWNGRDLTTKLAFQQWESQYRDDFFSIADWLSGRYFTGRFAAPLTYTPAGNNQWNIQGQFMELPGLPMFAYPTNWARDSIVLACRDGFGEDLVKLSTGWALGSSVFYPNGFIYSSAATNSTGEWLYYGYGFRFHSSTGPDRGIIELTATRVRDGSVVQAATNIDLYAAVLTDAVLVFTLANLGLDFYRVKLRETGTKNSSSTGVTCVLWSLDVMR